MRDVVFWGNASETVVMNHSGLLRQALSLGNGAKGAQHQAPHGPRNPHGFNILSDSALRSHSAADGPSPVQSSDPAYKFPRIACSRSMLTNKALKFPIPNPRLPCRSITSKNSVGRSCTGWVKICSR